MLIQILMFCTTVQSIMLASHNTDTAFKIHKYMRYIICNTNNAVLVTIIMMISSDMITFMY